MHNSQEKLEALLLLYFSQEISETELQELRQLVENPTNAKTLHPLLRTHYWIHLGFAKAQKHRTKERVFQHISKKQKQRKYWSIAYQIAAAILLFFGIQYALQPSEIELSPPEQRITLTLDDQKEYVIDDNFTSLTDASGFVLSQKKEQRLVYRSQAENSHTNYGLNTLEIPYGERFGLELEDGTLVQLNSGSSITFPVAFASNSIRRVQLSGEAYFKVAPDTARPFVVESQELAIQVLGTSFNVMSYPDENRVEVVLTEGLVQLKDIHQENNSVFLTPDHRAVYKLSDQQFRIDAVPTEIYTSWIDGKIVFRNLRFDQIIKRLERVYNVKIYLRDSLLAKELFFAGFDISNENLDDILQYFQKIHPFEYRVLDAQTLEIYQST